MDQLNAMFNNLKRTLSLGADTNQPLKKCAHSACETDDATEEDGFVLIDHTESNNMTVYSSTPDKNNSSQHNSVNHDAAAHTAERGFTMFATCDPQMSDHSSSSPQNDHCQNIADHPALTGIPFQLNPKLQEKDRLQTMLNQISLQTDKFDWQKYYYDFDFERSSVTELCAMERE